GTPTVIFNRICFVDLPQFFNAAQVDRDYARMEAFALLLSWLSSPGCPVINRPAPSALTGSAYRLPMWARLARVAGLTPLRLMAPPSTRRLPAHPTAARRPDLAPGGASDREGLPRPNDFSWFSEPVGSSNLSLLTIGGSIPKNAPASLRAPCYRL